MNARRVLIIGSVATGIALGALALLASPVGAAVTGPCSGSATITGDDFETERVTEASNKVRVPAEGAVDYEGRIGVPRTQDMPYEGNVKLKLPLGTTITIRDWDGTTDKVRDMGSDTFSIPETVLGSVKVAGEVNHTQSGVTCKWEGEVEIDAGIGVAAAGSAAGTGAAGVGMAMSTRAKKP